MIPKVRCLQKRIPKPWGRLSASARLLIGLRYSKVLNRHRVAEIMQLERSEVNQFWRSIQADRYGKKVIRDGLPAMFGESLPEGVVVTCPSCGRLITWVPCVSCCTHDVEIVDNTEDKPLPETDVGTYELPGTADKVEVMRKRVELGFGPFCYLDAKIPD